MNRNRATGELLSNSFLFYNNNSVFIRFFWGNSDKKTGSGAEAGDFAVSFRAEALSGAKGQRRISPPACHSERREESEILRSAQNDIF